jgi:hypothetical protein
MFASGVDGGGRKTTQTVLLAVSSAEGEAGMTKLR